MTNETQPKSGPASDRRAQGRQTTNLRTVATIDARHVACQVVNLSRTGALVATGAHVRLGQALILEIPGLGPAPCRVQSLDHLAPATAHTETHSIAGQVTAAMDLTAVQPQATVRKRALLQTVTQIKD